MPYPPPMKTSPGAREAQQHREQTPRQARGRGRRGRGCSSCWSSLKDGALSWLAQKKDKRNGRTVFMTKNPQRTHFPLHSSPQPTLATICTASAPSLGPHAASPCPVRFLVPARCSCSTCLRICPATARIRRGPQMGRDPISRTASAHAAGSARS